MVHVEPILLGSEAPIGCCSTLALGAERQTDANEATTSAERCIVTDCDGNEYLGGFQEEVLFNANIMARDRAAGQARLKAARIRTVV